MREDDLVIRAGVNGRLEVWLRGVLYTHTTDMEYALMVCRSLRWNNRKVA